MPRRYYAECYEKDVGFGVLERYFFILLGTFYEFQPVWGRHLVESHYHIHLIINTVSAVTGKRYHKEPYELMRLLEQLAGELKDYHIALMQVTYYDENGKMR